MPISNEYPGYNKKKSSTKSQRKSPKKGKGKKKKSFGSFLGNIVLLAAIAALIFSGVKLYTYFFGEKDVDELNKELVSKYSDLNKIFTNSEKNEQGILKKLEEMHSKNEDLIGWVEIDGTDVSYPVMQGDDNAFYLKHNYNKEESKAGSIFADYRGIITKDEHPDNYVLYGHDMKSGEFFEPLAGYKKIDFFKEHQMVVFDTLYEEAQWEVFACFLTGGNSSQDDGNFFNYYSTQYFNSESEFNEFYDEVMKRTYFNTDVDVNYGDELLTLSTCSREYWNSRFVIVARKVSEGDDSTTDASSVVVNEDKYMPKEWYEVQGLKSFH